MIALSFALRKIVGLNTELLHHTSLLVQKDFYFEDLKDTLPADSGSAFETMKKQLAQRIAYMMDDDFETLMQIFYRIDLNERAVHDAIHLADVPAEKLAELVIEREIQKAKTRIAYSNRQRKNDTD